MGTLIVVNMMSLDGFYAGPGGDLMLLPHDGGAFDSYNLERLRAAGTVLVGANSFAAFSGYWPSVADDSAASPTARTFAHRYNEVEKLVVSDHTPPPADDHPWAESTRIISRAEAHDVISTRKRQGDRDMVTWGSRTLWHDLAVNGLVDELHLMVGAAPAGAGVTLFGDLRPELRLIDSREFEGSDNLLLRYRVSQQSHPHTDDEQSRPTKETT